MIIRAESATQKPDCFHHDLRCDRDLPGGKTAQGGRRLPQRSLRSGRVMGNSWRANSGYFPRVPKYI